MGRLRRRLNIADPGRRWLMLAVVGCAAMVLAVLPVAGRPWPALPGIVALSVAGFVVTELSTSFLLLVRFRALGTWSVLVLACAYFYSGLMSIPHLLTFPGAVLTDQPLLGTSIQSSSWIYNLWINGFALLSLLAVCLEARPGAHRIATENVTRAIGLGLCLTMVAALAVILIVTMGVDYLPLQVSGASYTRVAYAVSFLGYLLLAASIAIVLFAIDEQNRLFLWLGLASTVMLAANLIAIGGGGRFVVGWTIGRLGWLVSACVLFTYLMVLHARDQHLWEHARDLLRGDTERGATQPTSIAVALDEFVARQNVMRYGRMLEETHDKEMRQFLQQLLADEQRRLDQLGKLKVST